MVRSLEPMAKKSATWVSASAASAAPGTSIITPSGGSGSGSFCPRRFMRRATCSSASRTCFTSETEEIIGNRMRTGPCTPARRIARQLVVQQIAAASG